MSAISGIVSNSESIQVDYLNLLITQLQNQNPLEPMDSSDMTAQLTAISQLEQLERLNGRAGDINDMFQQAMLTAELNEATALIGKTISFFPEGSLSAVSGQVDGVNIVDGVALLNVGEYNVALDDVKSISE